MTAAITIQFKKPELTIICVDSLLADGWSPVLVWDNSDDQGISLSVLQAKYSGDERIHLVCSPANFGFGKGMNAALAALERQGYVGPVLLINNDAQVQQGLRKALTMQLVNDDIPTLVAPRLMQDGREQGWLYYQPWLALVSQRQMLGSFAYLSGCCLMVQRPNNTMPLFNESFFMYGEDIELSWRIRREGGKLVLLDCSYLLHDGSASSGQASPAYERYLVQSHWLLAEKLASNALSRTLMRVLRIPLLFARAFLRSLRFRSWVPLLSFYKIFR